MRAELIDFVYSRIVPKEDIALINRCVGYTRSRWVREQYSKVKVKEEASMIDGRGGRFLTGLIPRIEKYCLARGIPFTDDRPDPLPFKSKPNLPGIDFRRDQLGILYGIDDHQRGVVKSPTGSGKTVLAGGICSMWPNSNILFLCHTIDLLTQSYNRFVDWGLEGPVMLGGGADKSAFQWQSLNDGGRHIVISTIQTFINYDLFSNPDFFDIVIIDECHHLTDPKSQYGRLMNHCLAPIRIGLSATPPDENKEKERKEALTLEGYLGPIIGEFTMQEAIKAGVIARPLINMIPVPYYDEIADMKQPSYKAFYQKGVIENRARNRLILSEAYKSIQAGESGLILVGTVIDHGHILSQMAKDIFDLDIPFIYGSTEKSVRSDMLQAIEKKEILWAIANVVWKEGVDIPSLNHVINAAGQAKERATLQRIGRGQRATSTKKFVKITDFLDPYKYLSYHCVLRMITYANEGWLNYDAR